MKTINVTVFATQANTQCESREEFEALITHFKQEFAANFADQLANRCGSDGESVKADVSLNVVEGENPNHKASGIEDEFSVMITDNTGTMGYTTADEWTNALERIIDEFEYHA